MNILITGGASGLGEAITNKCATDPSYKVYFTYHSSESNAQRIASMFNNAFPIKCDFKNQVDLDNLVAKIKELNIDILINNAYYGSFLKTYFHKTSLDNFLIDFSENIIPTIKITQAAINAFRLKKTGKIITILTSALINKPPLGSAVYIANKAYLEALTKMWAVENIKFNITSNSISPSFMKTSFTKDIDERIIDHIIDNHPLKSLLDVTEVADSVYYLCNATSQINGMNFIINSAQNLI